MFCAEHFGTKHGVIIHIFKVSGAILVLWDCQTENLGLSEHGRNIGKIKVAKSDSLFHSS